MCFIEEILDGEISVVFMIVFTKERINRIKEAVIGNE